MKEYRGAISDNLRWADFVHRPGDIFVCTPAKCGTTWTQTIIASLLWPDGDAPRQVLVMFPWLEMQVEPIEKVLARLDRQTHRRCIKSHTPADGIPWFDDAQYIVVGRDGRDAFMSLVNHVDKLRDDVMGALNAQAEAQGVRTFGAPGDVHEFFAKYLDDAEPLHHIRTFWERRGEPNLLFVHYNDLTSDLETEMRRIAGFLGIGVPEAKWPAVVERCTFDSMKARGDEIANFGLLFEGGSDSFLHKGTNGRWRDVLTAEELAAYDRRVAEMLPADAVAWLERGRVALPV